MTMQMDSKSKYSYRDNIEKGYEKQIFLKQINQILLSLYYVLYLIYILN